jgi:hypothetical protein
MSSVIIFVFVLIFNALSSLAISNVFLLYRYMVNLVGDLAFVEMFGYLVCW